MYCLVTINIATAIVIEIPTPDGIMQGLVLQASTHCVRIGVEVTGTRATRYPCADQRFWFHAVEWLEKQHERALVGSSWNMTKTSQCWPRAARKRYA